MVLRHVAAVVFPALFLGEGAILHLRLEVPELHIEEFDGLAARVLLQGLAGLLHLGPRHDRQMVGLEGPCHVEGGEFRFSGQGVGGQQEAQGGRDEGTKPGMERHHFAKEY